MVKYTIERRSKAERKQARVGYVLKELLVTQATLKRYELALQFFFAWLNSEGYALPRSLVSLDEVIAEWISSCFQEGESIGLVGDGISGIQHFFPSVRGHLKFAWRLHAAWRKYELPAQAPPFTDEVLAGLVGLSLMCGDLPLAASLALGFHCFLRSGEIFALQSGHVTVSQTSGAVLLPITKKGIRDSVSINDADVARLVSQRLASSQPGDLLIGRGPGAARSALNELLRFFEIGDYGFRWYSCRRGGATADFRSHGQMEKTLVRGRWESSRTARVYITDGIAALVQVRLSIRQRSLLQWAARQWLR